MDLLMYATCSSLFVIMFATYCLASVRITNHTTIEPCEHAI